MIRDRLGFKHVTLKTDAHFLEVADRDAATTLGAVVAALAPPRPSDAGESPLTRTMPSSTRIHARGGHADGGDWFPVAAVMWARTRKTRPLLGSGEKTGPHFLG